MILFPHMMAGAAIGSKISNKKLIFFLILLSLLSHYLLDAIPHFEYDVTALNNGLNLNFFIAAGKVLLDVATGFFFIFFLLRKQKALPYALAGAFVALAPDFLIFLSWQLNNLGFLNDVLAFGTMVHFPNNNLTSLELGITTQIAAVALVFLSIKYKSIFANKKSGDLERTDFKN